MDSKKLSSSDPRDSTRPRRWVARVALAVLAPCLALFVLELGLRLVGFGVPTNFLVPGSTPGTLVDNPAFGRRFFPAGRLRVPPPTRITREKAPGTVRILIFGESAAMGDPKPAFGVARYLEVLLRERHPGTAFEVIPMAMTAINSHALLPMARESVGLGADLWIVFAGNNEVLGPFGAGKAFGGSSRGNGVVRLSLAAKATRVGQAVEALAARFGGEANGGSRWSGLKLLAEERIVWDSAERAAVYRSFEENLRDMVRVGKSAGVQVLVSSVAVNLRDSGPFRSVERAGMTAEESRELESVLDKARRSLTNGAAGVPRDLDAASIRRAIALDPDHAAAVFLEGQLELAAGDTVSAKRSFEEARDRDAVPLRADSVLNGVTRKVAQELGVDWIDAETRMSAVSVPAVVGREFFYEHVHFTPEGNHALARIFAEAVEARLPESVRGGGQGEWASAETCATRLGLTPWARRSAAEQMLRRSLEAPFTQRVDQEEQVMVLAQEVARQRRAQTPQAARFVQSMLENAVAVSTNDLHALRNLAEFLEANGNLKEAASAWGKVVAGLPHHPFAYLQAGSLLRRLGEVAEATPLIDAAVRMQPDWVEARLEQADLLLALKRPGDAVAACEAALKLQPDHARAYFRLADAQAAHQQRELAVKSLQEAVRLDPRLWEARYLLGVELALAGAIEPAREQFSEVVRLKPDHALGHLNLGIAFARQGRWDDASRHLAEVLRLDPRNDSAKQALAQIASVQRPSAGATPAETPTVNPTTTPP